ncbi:MAG TPA: CDP-alcohol phosphatidyltransferase family protein [Gemmatimonadales bacterium]|nr:CDP-alcohol phosphatidyltransferase family protein [Gemmatimonadales bacterium]
MNWSARQRIPNAISSLRIALAAALVPAMLTGRRSQFLGLLIGALATDALDGLLARWLDATSELGKRLDSWGDYILVAAALPGLVVLWPDLMRREAAWLVLAVVAYFAPTVWGLVRSGRIPALHTRMSKALAVGMAIALPVLLLGGPALPFRVLCALQVVAAVEEFAIVRKLA